MATFYTLQAANRRKSLLLVVVVVLLLAVLGGAIGFGMTGTPAGTVGAVVTAVVVAVVLSLGSYFAGDALVLATSGAHEVTQEQQPELLNVVRELALAARLPMPKVYLIEDSAPNAFATGRDPEHASVAVTTGLLDKLDREELQGVIGHEFAHVGNYDVRFALLVAVLVGSIALLADLFLRWTWFSGVGGHRSRGSRDSGGGGAQALVLILAFVLALLAPFFARLVQMAVSRQREYLADATSVQFTRNPVGLERALAKIAGDAEVLEVANRATQHLYIVNPIKKFEQRAQGLFTTHPPIIDRINRLRALHGAPPLAGDAAGAVSSLE